MRKNETKYRDFQLYLLHMHNVDRMKYDNSGELERIKENLRWVKEKYPELRELSNEELRRIANSDSDSPGSYARRRTRSILRRTTERRRALRP